MMMKKNATLFWYSQTGQSYTCGLKAAEVLTAEGWDVATVPLKHAGPRHFEAQALVFAFPVHNFQVPVTVKRLISAMAPLASARPAFAVITYAGAPANTVWLLRRLLAGKNIRLAGHLLVRCRDSYIPFVKWLPFLNDKSKPDASSFKSVEQFVREAVLNQKRMRRPFFNPLDPFHWIGAGSPANGPKWFLGRRIFKRELCVRCGTCAGLCPSGAITMAGGEIAYDDRRCLGCCGCLNVCPANAWVSSWFDPSVYNKGLHVRDMAAAMSAGKNT
jgi:ferredoxin